MGLQDVDRSAFPELTVSGPAAEPSLIRFSLPLSAGQWQAADAMHLRADDGSCSLIQSRPLISWPDGSVRWLDCQALVNGGGSLAIVPGAAAGPEAPVRCRHDAAELFLDNGLVAVTVAADGPSPIRSICFGGQEVGADVAFEATVMAAPSNRVLTSATAAGARQIRLLQAGPVRAIAEVTGAYAAGTDSMMKWRLRVELVAGLPQLVVRHWFVHMDPGVDHHCLRQIALTTRWQCAEPATRHLRQQRYGMTGAAREVITRQPLDMRTDSAATRCYLHNADALGDAHQYPYFMPAMDDTLPYAGLQLAAGWVTLYVDDFRDLCPTGLVAAGDALTVQAWPDWAPPTELPQGRSRETVFRLLFTSGPEAPDAGRVLGQVGAGRDLGKASLPQSWYERQRCWWADQLLPHLPSARNPADRCLQQLAGLPTVIGMWDLGDTIDPGYNATYASAGRLARVEVPKPYFYAGGHYPLAEWSGSLMFEPVWANNEYDAIIALCREVFRGGGTAELEQRLRWFGRHAIEVDFVHFSDHPEMHHGSPAHSARHGMATAYPSHLWAEGLLAYYCLSGDDDALETVISMGDFILRVFADSVRRAKLWHFSRELGWALLYLAVTAEMTNASRFLDAANELADRLIAEPLSAELAKQMAVYSFGYASMALGIEALWVVTRREDLARWLVAVADQVTDHVHAGGPSGAMTLNYFNAAFAVSGDARYIRAALPLYEDCQNGGSWRQAPPFVKPMAMLYRGVSRFARYLRDVGGGA